MMSYNHIKRVVRCPLGAFLFVSLAICSSAATLDDLKKLEIICFVPSYLPQGFRLKTVEITHDEPDQEGDQMNRPLPLYSVEYGNEGNATFSIESAREGIGDRNIMEEEDAEETEIQTPLGAIYLIYRPKGKTGRKDEIKANWVSDANTNAEEAKGVAHPTLGRFHPKVFNMINCWISDSESPVVTEINLDAVEKNGNEFNQDGLKQDGEWLQCPVADTSGFMRYRALESKGGHYKIEYQENGGGTLTTAAVIEFSVEKRNIQRDGKPVTIRVLRVSSYDKK
jgi:hypothetical protein